MASPAINRRLDQVRQRRAQASDGWQLEAVGRRSEALAAVLHPGTMPMRIATLTEDCSVDDRDFLLRAYEDIGFLLELIDSAFHAIRQRNAELDTIRARLIEMRQGRPLAGPEGAGENPQQPEEPDYAAECSMKCAEPLFIRFLSDAKGGSDLVDTERVIVFVRHQLAIKSRGELNKDPQAAERWKALRAEFKAWRDHP